MRIESCSHPAHCVIRADPSKPNKDPPRVRSYGSNAGRKPAFATRARLVQSFGPRRLVSPAGSPVVVKHGVLNVALVSPVWNCSDNHVVVCWTPAFSVCRPIVYDVCGLKGAGFSHSNVGRRPPG